MSKYVITEKECDSSIDLSMLSSYLLIPSKFVNTHQRIKTYRNIRKLEVHYSIFPIFFSHRQTYAKNPRMELQFLGVVHPNGQVEELELKSSALVDGVFYFYVKRRTKKFVQVKNLGGTNEEKIIKPTFSRRDIQQHFTFSDICGRDPSGADRIS